MIVDNQTMYVAVLPAELAAGDQGDRIVRLLCDAVDYMTSLQEEKHGLPMERLCSYHVRRDDGSMEVKLWFEPWPPGGVPALIALTEKYGLYED